MATSTVWWILAGVAIAAELMTGAVYLLLIGIAFAAAAVAALLGFGTTTQTIVAAVVGAATVGFWYLRDRRRPRAAPSQANPDVILDVGGSVHVDEWSPEGTTTVRYRGAQWAALARPGAQPTPGPHRVVEITGNRLVLEKVQHTEATIKE